MLNLVQPPHVTNEAYSFFADSIAQMHNWCGEGVPSMDWLKNYPKEAHVVLSCNANSREEAIARCQVLRQMEQMRAQ